MSSNFQSANAAMLQMSNYGNIPVQPVPQQQNSAPELTPQKKAVFERLKKRMNLYRKRQTETIPRFDQTFTGICEQQNIETNLLQKKFLESKAKRVAKKTDKKGGDLPGGGIVVRFLMIDYYKNFNLILFCEKNYLTVDEINQLSNLAHEN